MSNRMRFGVFIAPFHAVRENPTLAMERDFELVQWADTLGIRRGVDRRTPFRGLRDHRFARVVHRDRGRAHQAHQAGHRRVVAAVSSPADAGRPHQPARPRHARAAMFGVGPGALPSDAVMMGIDISKQRDMMDEALDVLVPLLRGETVTKKTDWFTLQNARLQMRPYTRPRWRSRWRARFRPPARARRVATASGCSRSARPLRAASTRSAPTGQSPNRWRATAAPRPIVRSGAWLARCTLPRRARRRAKTCASGWRTGWDDFTKVVALPVAPADVPDPIDLLVESGFAVVGTPDDAIAQISRLRSARQAASALFVQLAHNSADWENTKRSCTSCLPAK